MFGEIRESTGGKREGIVEGEVVEEMRKNERQGAQDRNTMRTDRMPSAPEARAAWLAGEYGRGVWH